MGLIAPLLLASFGQWLVRLIRQRRELHESVAVPVAGTCAAAVVAIAGAWYLASVDITARLGETRKQLVATDAPDGVSVHALWLFLQSRFTLYGDTWRMAKDKLWFGWGMNSYAYVFQQYNSQQISKVDGLPTYYFDAHNDWLQSAAEHGLVGTTLLGLCALVPLLLGARRRELGKALPLYMMAGCGLILVYAWFEFPFGNTGVVVTWWLLFFAALQYSRLRSAASSSSRSSHHRNP
jgi:O-antigen ligase